MTNARNSIDKWANSKCFSCFQFTIFLRSTHTRTHKHLHTHIVQFVKYKVYDTLGKWLYFSHQLTSLCTHSSFSVRYRLIFLFWQNVNQQTISSALNFVLFGNFLTFQLDFLFDSQMDKNHRIDFESCRNLFATRRKALLLSAISIVNCEWKSDYKIVLTTDYG